MKHRLPNFFLSACFGLISAQTQAHHPLVTEDAGTQGKDKQQIELSVDRVSQQAASSRIGTFAYNYGSSDQLDFFISLPSTWSTPTGFNDVSIGSKYRFAENGRESWALKSELFLPTGDVGKGHSNDSHSLAATLVRTVDAAPWAIHNNVALIWHRYRQTADQLSRREWVASASVAVEYALDTQWQLLGDFGITQADQRQDRTHPVHAVLGLKYSPNSSIDLDAGIKVLRIQGYNERHVGVGLAWRY